MGGLTVGTQNISVSTLADSGAGSLREALLTSGERNITFSSSGDIELLSEITVSNGNFTINALNAPNKGVQIKGNAINLFGASNFSIGHMKFRAGNYSGKYEKSCLTIGRGSNNFHIYNCDFQWSPYDDLLTMYNEVGYPAIHDGLIEYCIFAESLYDSIEDTGKCTIIGRSNNSNSTYDVVYRRNLLLTCRDRMPLITGNGYSYPSLGIAFDNNLVVNWMRSGEVRWFVDASFRYNIYKYGQNSPWPNFGELTFDPQTQQYVNQSRFYHTGNEVWDAPDLTVKRAAIIKTPQSGLFYNQSSTPRGLASWYNNPQLLSCDDAYTKILTKSGSRAGGVIDSLTQRCLDDAAGTGGPLVETVTDIDYPDLTV